MDKVKDRGGSLFLGIASTFIHGPWPGECNITVVLEPVIKNRTDVKLG